MDSKTMRDWVQSISPEGLYFHKEPGPYLPEKPDRSVLVTSQPRPADMNEGLVRRASFSIRIRGNSNNPYMSEQDATAIDDAIRLAAIPFEIGPYWVISVVRTNGPGPIPGTPDVGRRTEFQAVYSVQSSVDI